ncbi:Rhodanese-like domain-containing protein [Cytidiella melzeri]|nr:Rhodanese-like domain-containing protein [Cytidiella melzeri]
MLRLTARRYGRPIFPCTAVLAPPPAVIGRSRLLSTSAARFNEFDKSASLPGKPKHAEQVQDWKAIELSYEQIKPRTEQPTADAYLIDVREPDEVLQGSIPSSVNLPLSVLANSLSLKPEAFKLKFGWEKPQRDQEIVFYCRSGVRSLTACDIAQRNGFTNTFSYKGSWLDWTARENEKKKS